MEISPVPGRAEIPAAKPELYQVRLTDRPTPNLNHSWPEDRADGPVVTGDRFISYGHHSQAERDLYAWYPRYNPGYVSFSPEGRAYIAAGELIQYLDGSDWRAVSLRPHLEKWAKEQGWAGLYHNWGAQGGEPVIRFDRDGNAYVLAQVEALNGSGRRYDWRTRTALLLFSPDRFKTFRVHRLPLPIAGFEKIDGNNPAALDRPPVILLSDYGYFDAGYRGLKFLLPKRNGDTLELGEPVEISEAAIGCNYHSGDGNIVLSTPDKLFVIWGWLLEYRPGSRWCGAILEELKKLHPGETDPAKLWTVDNLAKTGTAVRCRVVSGAGCAGEEYAVRFPVPSSVSLPLQPGGQPERGADLYHDLRPENRTEKRTGLYRLRRFPGWTATTGARSASIRRDISK